MAVYQNLTVTQIRQDADQNCSTVRILWQSTQTGPSYNLYADVGTYTLTVNGQAQQPEEITFVLPQNTTQTILDVEKTVFHNEKGEAEVTVQTWMNTHISAGIVELSQTVKLDTIPQASTVTASEGVIGGCSRLAVTRKNSQSAHSVFFRFGALEGYITPDGQISGEEVIFSGERVDFYLPESFYGQIPHSKSGICQLTLCTYADGIPVGTPQTTEFTVLVEENSCIPTISGAVVDVNPKTVELTGDDRFLIRYCSNALCTVTGSAKNGAQLVKKRILGREVEASLQITGTETGDFPMDVTDSRGLTASYLAQTVCVPYIKLSCLASAVRDDPTSGEATLDISGDCFTGSFGAKDNQLSLSYSTDGENFLPAEPALADNRYTARVQLTGLDYTRLHTVTVRASDSLMTVEKQVTVKKGVPTFDWGEGDFAFHVPVQMDSSLAVAGSLTVGGKGLTDLIYPVGSVYLCEASVDPGAVFGGTWVMLSQQESIYRWRRTG